MDNNLLFNVPEAINKILENYKIVVMPKDSQPVQLKHGQWLKNGDRYCECSVCHHEGNTSGHDNYCWYCGADMMRLDDAEIN